MALGKFSFVDQDMTDGCGQAGILVNIWLCMIDENLQRLDQDVK